MAVITAGLYRVDLFQNYINQEVVNSFWYRELGGDNDQASALNLALDNVLMTPLATMQHEDVLYVNLRCTPMFGIGIEDNRTPAQARGLKTGTKMSTFMAASIRLNRSTNELRNGWKRFTGLTEEEVGASAFAAPLITELQAIGGVIDMALVDGAKTFQPVIVRKPFSTLANSPSWEFTDVASTTVLDRPTTQSSRKQF